MEKKELLTVQQFADAAGVSKQAIYKAINGQLKPFIQIVNGKKMIQRKALSEIYGIEVDQPLTNRVNPLNLTLQMLQQQLEEKDRQLAAKDKQIEKLSEELAKEREHSRGTTDKLALLADQAQKLHAIDQLQPPAEEVVEPTNVVLEAEPEQKKRGFFSLFKKNKE